MTVINLENLPESYTKLLTEKVNRFRKTLDKIDEMFELLDSIQPILLEHNIRRLWIYGDIHIQIEDREKAISLMSMIANECNLTFKRGFNSITGEEQYFANVKDFRLWVEGFRPSCKLRKVKKTFEVYVCENNDS